MELQDLLAASVKNNASDLHLCAEMPALFRIDGSLKSLSNDILSAQQVEQLLMSLMTPDQQAIFNEHKQVDFSFDHKLARFRANIYRQAQGMSAALRTIPNEIKTLSQLSAPSVLTDICHLNSGLVLITGPTGSGKTTTLAAMLNHMNQHQHKHIITLEDPIEYIHRSEKCLINQRQIFRDVVSFSSGLRAALREDPDIILVGELRDLETIRLALTAAETGHLVFATVHTASAAKTINRLVDVFPGNEKELVRGLLAESLQAVVAQILLPKKQGGRVAAYEIMIAVPAIRNLIRENKVAQMYSTIQTGSSKGMQTLEQNIDALLQQKIIDVQAIQMMHGQRVAN